MKIEKIMDVGTSNPIVARLGLGLDEIIKLSMIDPEKKEKIKNIIMDIMHDLVEAEKAILPLIEELVEAERELRLNGVKTQSNGRVIVTPSLVHLSSSKVFLKYAKQSLQKFACFFELIFDEKYNGPHFHKIAKKSILFFGESHIVTKLLLEDSKWIKDIIDLRNEDEHPKTGKNFTNGYQISQMEDGKYYIILPTFFNGIQILSALEAFSGNLLTFVEELVAHTLEHYFPPKIMVFSIPEHERDSECPIRFKLGFTEDMKF